MDLHFEQDGHGDEGDDGSQDGPLEALQHVHQQHQEREDDAIVLGHFRRSRWQKLRSGIYLIPFKGALSNLKEI